MKNPPPQDPSLSEQAAADLEAYKNKVATLATTSGEFVNGSQAREAEDRTLGAIEKAATDWDAAPLPEAPSAFEHFFACGVPAFERAGGGTGGEGPGVIPHMLGRTIMLLRAISAAIVLMLMASSGCDEGTSATGFSWKQDGVTTRASSWLCYLSGPSLRLIALTRSEFGLVIGLSPSSGPLLPGTFVCNAPANGFVNLTLLMNGDSDLIFKTQSCSVSLTHVGEVGGANATGTFEATAVRSDGKVTNLTNGSFNVPIKDL